MKCEQDAIKYFKQQIFKLFDSEFKKKDIIEALKDVIEKIPQLVKHPQPWMENCRKKYTTGAEIQLIKIPGRDNRNN